MWLWASLVAQRNWLAGLVRLGKSTTVIFGSLCWACIVFFFFFSILLFINILKYFFIYLKFIFNIIILIKSKLKNNKNLKLK
jgi:cobalamin biosynthesis protein CobD/CbiB